MGSVQNLPHVHVLTWEKEPGCQALPEIVREVSAHVFRKNVLDNKKTTPCRRKQRGGSQNKSQISVPDPQDFNSFHRLDLDACTIRMSVSDCRNRNSLSFWYRWFNASRYTWFVTYSICTRYEFGLCFIKNTLLIQQ